MKGDPFANQLITFTRCLCEGLPIEYCDFASTALYQSRVFQLPSSIRDRGPLSTQHFREEILRNPQGVLVTAVAHHE
jgi:hypothetical protein